MFKEGTVKEERQLKRKQYIIRSLAESPKRWSELKDSLYKKNRWFKSKHDLSNTLKELEEKDKLIVKKKVSHKNVQYFLTEDFEKLRQLQLMVNKRWEELHELLKEIREHDEPRKVTHMKTNDFVLQGLINYLNGVEATVRAPYNLRSYARGLLDRFTDEFAHILVACGQRDGDATDFVLWQIKNELCAQMYAKVE